MTRLIIPTLCFLALPITTQAIDGDVIILEERVDVCEVDDLGLVRLTTKKLEELL